MNLPNLFPLLSADSDVAAIVGTRIYPFGNAPQNVTAPYVTQFAPSIAPQNTLDAGGVRVDSCVVQVSCWSDNTGTGATGIATLAAAVRACLESVWDIESVRDMGRDFETMRYRIDFDVRVFVHRSSSS